MPKFRRKKIKNYKDNAIERWLAFLEKDIPEATLKELMDLEPAIEKAEKTIEYLSSDKETMSMYWERERSLHERANMINSAEKRGDLKRAKVAIKNMLEKGMEKEFIMKILEVDIKLIEDIEKEILK